jgi:hypothetical protein
LSRRLIQEVLIAGPVILVLGIATDARTRVESHDFVQYDATLNSRLLAYSEPVLAVKRASRIRDREARGKAIRSAADLWIQLYRRARLLPLYSAHADDCVRDGVKGEIADAAIWLSGQLRTLGGRAEVSGKTVQAASDYIQSVEVADVVKYSDLYSVSLFATLQEMPLSKLSGLEDKLEPSQRVRIAERLLEIAERPAPLSLLAARARRNFLRAEASRGVERQDIEEVQRFIDTQELVSSNLSRTQVDSAFRELLVAFEGGSVPSYVTEVRFAWTAQWRTARALDELILRLRRPLRR